MSETDTLQHARSVLEQHRRWLQQRQQMQKALPGSTGEYNDEPPLSGERKSRSGSSVADVLEPTILALEVTGQFERTLSTNSLKQTPPAVPDLTGVSHHKPSRPRDAWGGAELQPAISVKEGPAPPKPAHHDHPGTSRSSENRGESRKLFSVKEENSAASAPQPQLSSALVPTLRPSLVRAWGDLDELSRRAHDDEVEGKEAVPVQVEPRQDETAVLESSALAHETMVNGHGSVTEEDVGTAEAAMTREAASVRRRDSDLNGADNREGPKGNQENDALKGDVLSGESGSVSHGSAAASPNQRLSRRKRQFAKKKNTNAEQDTKADTEGDEGPPQNDQLPHQSQTIKVLPMLSQSSQSQLASLSPSVPRSMAFIQHPSTAAGMASIINQLPPLRTSRMLSSEDRKTATRPVAPPSYYLPAHQEKRPDGLPELSCPLYGEVDQNEDFADRANLTGVTPDQLHSLSHETTMSSETGFGQGVIPSLHHAAWVGNARRLESLLRKGHSVNEEDSHGRTALMYSCSVHGAHILCADVLLKHGANLDHQAQDGSTALHEAAYVGALSLIELLIHNGASPLRPDQEGRLPVHYTTYNKTDKCLAALAKAPGVDINAADKAGMTPLMWAAYHNRPEVVAWLLQHGADREEKDIDGRTAMHWAVHKDSVKCLKLLLEHDMTFFKDHRGLTVLHIAADRGSMPATKMILKMRPDSIHDLDRQGRSPLHWAAVCSRVDVCLLLLEYGTSPTLKDSHGKTPLDYAHAKDLKYVVALLMCYDWDSRPALQPSTSSISLLSRFSSRVASELSGGMTSPKSTPTHNHPADEHLPSAIPPPQTELSDEHRQIVTDGCYLKYFTGSGRGPLQDRFFWFSPNNRNVCWSKLQADRILGDYNSARLIAVQTDVNPIVAGRSDFAPKGRHRYSFTLLTSSVVMAVVAYTSSHHQAWVEGLGKLLQHELQEQVASSPSIQSLKSSDNATGAWTGNPPQRPPRQQLFQVAGYASTQLDTLSQP